MTLRLTKAEAQRIAAQPGYSAVGLDEATKPTPAARELERAGIHDEATLQITVMNRCQELAEADARYGQIFHPANGEYRARTTAIRLKLMGVRSGVLDMYLIYRNWQGLNGWACDLKMGKNTPTTAQEAEIAWLRSQGWWAGCLWDDVEVVMGSLRWYLDGEL